MKKLLIVATLVVVTCLLTWSLVRSDNHEVEEVEVDKDSIVEIDKDSIIIAEYKWNGELHRISFAELEAAIAELPVYKQQNYANKKGKAEYLETYINEKLKLLQATDEGFDKLEDHLKKMENYSHQLMVEKLTEIEVDEKISITDADLMAYYEKNKSDYIEEEKVRVTCITLDDENLANETLDKILAGKDIKDMAKELTEANKVANGPGTSQQDPGNTFFFGKSASSNWSEFIDAVFEMKVNEITETVFETDVGEDTFYLIFRKEEEKSERQKEIDEVKSDINRKVERKKKRTRILEWVEEISKAGKLKTYPENIPETLLPEPENTKESKISDK